MKYEREVQTVAVKSSPSQPPVSLPSRSFSPEIHGVRGLALTMVVAFHLFGRGRVSGGVDVFLVISSYLLGGSLIRALEAGKLSLLYRYGRTFSRLLPAALLTILGTVIAGIIILPQSRWLELFKQGYAASIFSENIYLGTEGLAYGAADDASPFQHFWSLSMQGQFFLLLPLLAYLILLFARRLRGSYRVAIFALVLTLTSVVSFFYAIHLVAIDQAAAYYSLGARLWEFGLGALAAFMMPLFKRQASFGAWAGWLGVALILSSGFVLDGARLFPGPWALWPVLGALLVLFSADSGGAPRLGLTRALSAPPMVWLANRGYALYLWHWPILVFYLAIVGLPQVGLKGAVSVLVLALIFTELTQRLVSTPFVRWSNRQQKTVRGRWWVVASLVLAVTGVAALTQAGILKEEARISQELASAAAAVAELETTGADLDEDAPVELPASDPDGPWMPRLEVAAEDKPDIYKKDCIQASSNAYDEVLVCPDFPGENAVEWDPANGKRPRIVMSGGSHVTQHYPAIRTLADEQGWELLVVDKHGCRLATTPPDSTRSISCQRWNEKATDVILDLEPDAVITLGTVTQGALEGKEKVSPNQVEVWQTLSDNGIPVVAIEDTPRFPYSIPGCLRDGGTIESCGLPRSSVYEDAFLLAEEELPALVVPVEVSQHFCDETFCPPVIGNVIAYRDAGHLSATFSQTLVPTIRTAMKDALPSLFPH